jgi:hypothetical protein
MAETIFDAGDASTLEISGAADVEVIGGPEDRVYFVPDSPEQLNVERDADTIRVRTRGDLRARVPRQLHLRLLTTSGDARVFGLGSGLEVENVADLRAESIRGDVAVGNARGDVTVKGVDGEIRCAAIAGDLRIEGGRSAEVGNVGGDARLRAINGPTSVERVGGDTNVEALGGPVRLSSVGGDLVARGLAAGLDAPRVGGDLRLQTPLVPGDAYVASCGGSADLVIPSDPAGTSATFELRSDAREIVCAVPLTDVAEQPGFLSGRLGDGEATVRIHSGGRIRVAHAGEPFSGRPGSFERGFEEMMAGIGEGIEASIQGAFAGAFGGGPGGRFERKMQEMSERIARQAEEAARRATRRADEMARREAERAQRQAERVARRAGRWGFGPPPGPWTGGWPRPPAPPPAPARPKPTEEERLVILRMLADGKISTEEATRLLEALGG